MRNNPLRQCETEDIFAHVKRCATELNDTRILALLITDGDLVAQEAKYHIRCLSHLYNRARQQEALRENSDEHDSVMCEGIAFANLIIFIREKLRNLEGKCVFRMGDLRRM